MVLPKASEFKRETYDRLVTILKARFNNIKTTIDEIICSHDSLTSFQDRTLKTYMNEVHRKKEDFENNFQRVLVLPNDDDASNAALINDQNEINDLYIYIISRIESSVVADHEVGTSLNGNVNDTLSISSHSQVRLPKINLPKFSGDLATWTSFINLYDTTIHNNSTLSDVMRFQYLLSTLEKEPLNLIRSLNITAHNYTVAYNLLRDRYHNDRRLQILHLNQLLDLPNISSSHINGVRTFVNLFTENAQALSALGCNVEDSNPLLVAVLLRKMDIELRRKLESSRVTSENTKHNLPTTKQIIDYLNDECTHLEDAMLSQRMRPMEFHSSQTRTKPIAQNVVFPKKNVTMTVTQVTPQSAKTMNQIGLSLPCFVCNQISHKIYTCPVFLAQTAHERFQSAKKHQRCVSCLGAHETKLCKSLSMCKICDKRHHTLLHFPSEKPDYVPFCSSENINRPKPNKPPTKEIFESKPDTSVILTSQHHSSDSNMNTTVVLGTLLVQISSLCGNNYVFRALVDSGSMCNLITERAATLLKLPRHKSMIQLSGIDHHITRNKGQAFIDIKTLSGQTIVKSQPTLILDKLTVDLPRAPLSLEVLKLTHAYNLADPTFHVPGRIDLVIGGALFPQILTQEKLSFGPNLPYALGTHFGYIIMGTAPCLYLDHELAEKTPTSILNVCLHTISDADLHSSIQRFWVQEELPMRSTKTHEEMLCDKHFSETHTRNSEGRYMVRLPFKESTTTLGKSKLAAERRLLAMEHKFSSNGMFSQLYHEFMDEFLILGHMSEASNLDLTQPHYFMPHHGVIKETSSTTKLRAVFDASSKTNSGISLNEILMTGPKLQNNICDLLLQFRTNNVVFCCDIRQMYRQISVHPDDRKFQLILWRTNIQHPFSTYQLNTVTYGMNSSPYLAIKTLHQLAEDEGKEFPVAAHALRHHTYVDDIIMGAETEEEAIVLQKQLIELLKRGGFELRKWVSNSSVLLETLSNTYLETPKFLQNSDIPHFTVLGLQWSPSADNFFYNCQTIKSNKTPSKRTVLSTIAQIFDPCGFLVPFIMLAKCFMQLLWTKGLSWDSPLPLDLQLQWKSFIDDISCLSQISIPRSLNLSSTYNIELHGFCDASELGYAAVTYIRCEFNDKPISVNILMAKSRVAPLKRVTIPRLELCGAYLLAHLIDHIKSIFPNIFHSNNTHLWCDSTVVLTWLQTPPYRLKTYVANRVSQIQELIPTESWKHIRSEQNPADCASRGLRMSQLTDYRLWWTGPTWLSHSSSEWPSSTFKSIELDSSHELKQEPLPILVNTQQHEWSLLTKFSSWNTLQRTMAFVLRFVYNCRNSKHRIGYISTKELQEARNKICSLVQQNTFADEFMSLVKHQPCSKSIQRLNPFTDSNNLIRVGGRLNNAIISYDTRHPILLPKHHHVVDILIDSFHTQHLHAGPQLTQAILSQHYWILCARSVIRSRIFKCIICYKHRPKSTTPLMGDLPKCRVIPAKPFSSTGIDYGGPYNIKITNLKFTKQIKAYICIFVCMVTKAVHIEVVDDLTTAAFIAALTRFVARRGICNEIYSDCGTNFIGANTELRKIIHSIMSKPTSQDNIQHFTSNQGIRFHFNPPASPHHGGLWESTIKRAKFHLHRVIGSTVLTYPEFVTLITRVESMLNSRPLTPLSTDPSDVTALTPGHFLTGAPLTSVPEYNYINVPSNRLKHWQLTQAFFQNIWQRWKLEYLHTLQQRSKWMTISKNLKIGDLVLINSPSPPLQWPLGRITSIFPGQDGTVRVAEVRTSTNTFIRPVTKLCVLPIE